jgi:hypothetical protein
MLKTFIRGMASALLVVSMASTSTAQVAPVVGMVGSPPASEPPHVQLPVDALMQDAAEYARRFGVPFDEALRRLRAQGDSVPATDALRETFKDRWAGIAIAHLPTYRIVVLLTGTDPVPDQQVVAGGMTVPIVFRTGATATLSGEDPRLPAAPAGAGCRSKDRRTGRHDRLGRCRSRSRRRVA